MLCHVLGAMRLEGILLQVSIPLYPRHYTVEILPIRCKTLSNQPINQSIHGTLVIIRHLPIHNYISHYGNARYSIINLQIVTLSNAVYFKTSRDRHSKILKFE